MQKLFDGNTARADNKRVFRVEALDQFRQTCIGCPATAFHLDGNTLAVALNDEIDLLVPLPPIVDAVVGFLGIVQKVYTFSKLTPERALSREVL